MYQVLKKNWDKSKYLILTGIFITSILLLTVVYKSDEKIIKKSMTIGISYENPDLKTFKEFLLNQIKSPFTNLNYEIKRGDTIQKILKKLEELLPVAGLAITAIYQHNVLSKFL